MGMLKQMVLLGPKSLQPGARVEIYHEAELDFYSRHSGCVAVAIASSPPIYTSVFTSEHVYLLIDHQSPPQSTGLPTKSFSKTLWTVPADLSATTNLFPFPDYHIE